MAKKSKKRGKAESEDDRKDSAPKKASKRKPDKSKSKKNKAGRKSAGKKGDKKKADSKQSGAKAPATVTSSERHQMIAVAAYTRAEQEGFLGDPMRHWLEAERQVDGAFAGS